jgi:hypothetical protein
MSRRVLRALEREAAVGKLPRRQAQTTGRRTQSLGTTPAGTLSRRPPTTGSDMYQTDSTRNFKQPALVRALA